MDTDALGYVMTPNEREIYSAILGEKKVEIINLLLLNCDENGFIFCKISEICEILNVSKPTVIETFKLLQKTKIFSKIKNGLYKLNLTN